MGKHLRTFLPLTFLSFAILLSTQTWAQDIALASPVTVPHVVQYAGAVANSPGAAVSMKFALYAAQTGGEAVWSENQQVTTDSKGRYSVLLGSATEGGLPQQMFSSAQARWLGVTVGDAAEQPRVVLVATPYSLKASDAETLGGHPAADFALLAKDAKSNTLADITQISGSNGVLVNGTASTTATGPTVGLSLDGTYLGTLGAEYFAQIATANTFKGNQTINGNATINGALTVSGTIVSPFLDSIAAELPTLAGANTFSGSNTFSKPIISSVATGTAPFTVASATMVPNLNASLLGSVAPAAFAQVAAANLFTANQTLASNGTATASGGFDSASLKLTASAYNSSTAAAVPQNFFWKAEHTGNNTASPSATLNLLSSTGTAIGAETGFSFSSTGVITFASGQTFPAADLESTLNTVYAQLGGANTFTGNQTITGTESATASSTGGVITGTNSGGGYGVEGMGVTGVYASGTNYGVSATVSSAGGTAVFGIGPTGVAGESLTSNGTGVLGSSGSGTGGIGVSGQGDTGVSGSSTVGDGVYGTTSATGGPAGVLGKSTATTIGSDGFPGIGISGNATGPSSYGVYGHSTGSGGYGIYGSAPGAGVYGTSGSGIGVFGNATAADTNGVVAIESGAGGYGVYAHASGAQDTVSYQTIGVYGLADNGNGVLGVNTSASNTYTNYQTGFSPSLTGGVWGDTSSDGADFEAGGIVGTADNNSAAFFVNNSADESTVYASNQGGGTTGTVVPVITALGAKGMCGMNNLGDVTCSGRLKTAVPVAGSEQKVEVYSVQSAENWFEDFGSAQLEGGHATVAIDPQFAGIVNTGVEYHIFLTPQGECEGLYIASKSASGFEVRELHHGSSSVSFDYRIVAKRAGHESERMADATQELHTMTARHDRMEAHLAAAHSVRQRQEERDEITPPNSGPATHEPRPSQPTQANGRPGGRVAVLAKPAMEPNMVQDSRP